MNGSKVIVIEEFIQDCAYLVLQKYYKGDSITEAVEILYKSYSMVTRERILQAAQNEIIMEIW